jgi:hypothetical protein
MKAYEAVDVYVHVFLTSALVGECSVPHPSRLKPRRKNTPYPLARRLGEPWNRCGRREEKILLLPPDFNSDPKVVQPVASRYIDCDIPPPHHECANWIKFTQVMIQWQHLSRKEDNF